MAKALIFSKKFETLNDKINSLIEESIILESSIHESDHNHSTLLECPKTCPLYELYEKMQKLLEQIHELECVVNFLKKKQREE